MTIAAHQPATKLPVSFERLVRPLPDWHPRAWYFGATRVALSTVGRLSEGIRTGWKHGFDSGVMLDYVYRNEARGRGVLGRTIDRMFLDQPGWAGIRRRGAMVTKTLADELRRLNALGEPARVLDLACGGGRYVLDAVFRTGLHPERLVLRDYAEANVETARAAARRHAIAATCERADAFSGNNLAALDARPNVALVSGLHEIVDDDGKVRHHFRQLARVLARPAKLIFTVQPWHPQLELIARVLPSHTGKPWAMRLRSLAQTSAWARAAGFSDIDIRMERAGIFGVGTATLAA